MFKNLSAHPSSPGRGVSPATLTPQRVRSDRSVVPSPPPPPSTRSLNGSETAACGRFNYSPDAGSMGSHERVIASPGETDVWPTGRGWHDVDTRDPRSGWPRDPVRPPGGVRAPTHPRGAAAGSHDCGAMGSPRMPTPEAGEGRARVRKQVQDFRSIASRVRQVRTTDHWNSNPSRVGVTDPRRAGRSTIPRTMSEVRALPPVSREGRRRRGASAW